MLLCQIYLYELFWVDVSGHRGLNHEMSSCKYEVGTSKHSSQHWLLTNGIRVHRADTSDGLWKGGRPQMPETQPASFDFSLFLFQSNFYDKTEKSKWN